MRIAFNALSLRPDGTGVQTYIRELLRALRPVTAATMTAAVQADAVPALPEGVDASVRPRADGARRALLGLRPLPDADLWHGLDVDVPWRHRVPTVTTIHDLSVFDVPWAHPRTVGAGRRLLMRRAVRTADVVIAVSSFTAERVKARLGREAVVVLEGAPTDLAPAAEAAVRRARERWSLPERFVLHLGTVERRKNVHLLGDACSRAGLPLVLAGRVDLDEAPAGARCLGYVDRADVPALYGAAAVVAYPSLYEGFGLPPLEAMACGAPVVASTAASLPEVLADAAELVDPSDPEQLAKALREVAFDTDRRAALIDAGHRRVAALTWEAAATATDEIYRGLV